MGGEYHHAAEDEKQLNSQICAMQPEKNDRSMPKVWFFPYKVCRVADHYHEGCECSSSLHTSNFLMQAQTSCLSVTPPTQHVLRAKLLQGADITSISCALRPRCQENVICFFRDIALRCSLKVSSSETSVIHTKTDPLPDVGRGCRLRW